MERIAADSPQNRRTSMKIILPFCEDVKEAMVWIKSGPGITR